MKKKILFCLSAIVAMTAIGYAAQNSSFDVEGGWGTPGGGVYGTCKCTVADWDQPCQTQCPQCHVGYVAIDRTIGNEARLTSGKCVRCGCDFSQVGPAQ